MVHKNIFSFVRHTKIILLAISLSYLSKKSFFVKRVLFNLISDAHDFPENLLYLCQLMTNILSTPTIYVPNIFLQAPMLSPYDPRVPNTNHRYSVYTEVND